MKRKFILMLIIVSIFMFGCGIQGEFEFDNPFLGTWQCNECTPYEKYVFTDTDVSFYTSTDNQTWTLNNNWFCTYSNLCCTFNNITKSVYSDQIHPTRHSQQSMDIEGKRYFKQ